MSRQGDLTAIQNSAFLKTIREMEKRIAKLERRGTPVVRTLEDLTNSMGLIEAGEFRSGNGVEPGSGFTGGRFGYPGFTYGDDDYFLAGVVNDSIVVGMSLTTGKLIFASAAGVMDAAGILMTGLLFPLKFDAWDSATGNTYRRQLWMGMLEADGADRPAGRIALVDPEAGSQLLLNPDFETGTITNWTLETGWASSSTFAHAGTKSARENEEASATDRALTSDKFATTAGVNYLFSGWSKVTARFSPPSPAWKVEVKWYNAVPTLLQTDIVLTETITSTYDWRQFTATLVAPAGSTQAEVVVTKTESSAGSFTFYVDDFSFTALSVNETLTFHDDHLEIDSDLEVTGAITAAGNLKTTGGVIGLGAAHILTLSTDDLTISGGGYIAVAAETGTADNLDTIIGGAEGDILVLEADSGDTITVRDNSAGAGSGIRLPGAANKTLAARDKLVIIKTAGDWHTLTYSDN